MLGFVDELGQFFNWVIAVECASCGTSVERLGGCWVDVAHGLGLGFGFGLMKSVKD
tara:strand:- start:692 stop:859 length:168 start_codon:yes stop_codon:yes gene_type:complete